MARTYSITQAASLLGVSAATVSRRLPAARAGRGRSARLSMEEVIDLAGRVDVDPDLVRRRAALDEEFGSDMPAEASAWARVAAERGLVRMLAAHLARLPEGLLAEPPEEDMQLDVCEPWGEPGAWTPIRSAAALTELLLPGDR